MQLQLHPKLKAPVALRGGGRIVGGMAMMMMMGLASSAGILLSTSSSTVSSTSSSSSTDTTAQNCYPRRRYDRIGQHPSATATDFSSPPLLHKHPSIPQLIYYEFCL